MADEDVPERRWAQDLGLRRAVAESRNRGACPKVSLDRFELRDVRVEVHPCGFGADISVRYVASGRNPRPGVPAAPYVEFISRDEHPGFFDMPAELRMRTIRQTILRALMHEVDEHLQIDGQYLSNPHPEDPAYGQGVILNRRLTPGE